MEYFSSVAPDGKTHRQFTTVNEFFVEYRLPNKNFGNRSKIDAKVKDYCGIGEKK